MDIDASPGPALVTLGDGTTQKVQTPSSVPFSERVAIVRDPKAMAAELARLADVARAAEESLSFGDGTVAEFAAQWGGVSGDVIGCMPLPLVQGPPAAVGSAASMEVGKGNGVLATAALLARARSLASGDTADAEAAPAFRWPSEVTEGPPIADGASDRRAAEALTQKAAAAVLASVGFDSSARESLDLFASVMATHLCKLSALVHRLREYDVDEPLSAVLLRSLREMGTSPSKLRAHLRGNAVTQRKLRKAVVRLKGKPKTASPGPKNGDTVGGV